MHHQTSISSLSPAQAMDLILAARRLQPEARSFGEDINEGYLLLHEALADALRGGADPAGFAETLRALASKPRLHPLEDGDFAS